MNKTFKLNTLFKFCTQETFKNVAKKKYINIKKMMNDEQQKIINHKQNTFHLSKVKNSQNLMQPQQNQQQQQFQFDYKSPKFKHLSTQQQQLNYKIKTSISTSSLFQLHFKNKHKLQPRHYSLIFVKIIELRKNNPKMRQQTKQFQQFIHEILLKKLDKMSPEDLIRIIYSLKYYNFGSLLSQMKLIKPIINHIVEEFSNSDKNQLQPYSFQILRLSSNIKLFHSLSYILNSTGSQFQKKIKQIMRQTLEYILFRSLKNKKQTKSGQYLSLTLKLSFLQECKKIQASNAIVKNLIIIILSQKQKLTYQNLLDIQSALFKHTQLLDKVKSQLFTQKDVHIKYNVLFRIQNYINGLSPKSQSILIKRPQIYRELNTNMIDHLYFLDSLSIEELIKLEINNSKDQQIANILSIFHLAYKNCLIENFSSINQKQEALKFFKKSQHQSFACYHLIKFFYQKLTNQGVNSLRPSIKKQLKQFINLLCKFFTKLSYPTSTIIIRILILSNYSATSLRPLLTSYFQKNFFLSSQTSSIRKDYFFISNKKFKTQQFLSFLALKNKIVLQQDSQLKNKFQMFVNSNLRNILKFIMKRTERNNIQKWAFYLAEYCKSLKKQEGLDIQLTKNVFELVQKVYFKLSCDNRSFKKTDVDKIFNEKQGYMSEQFYTQNFQIKDQSDIYSQNLLQKQNQIGKSVYIIHQLQNDNNIFKEDYTLQQTIREKIRKLFQNFKFIILFYQNLKQILPSISEKLLTQEVYINLLTNFKTELECLKFQKLFTKQNCQDSLQIYNTLQQIWFLSKQHQNNLNKKLQNIIQINKQQNQKQNKIQIQIQKQLSKQKIGLIENHKEIQIQNNVSNNSQSLKLQQQNKQLEPEQKQNQNQQDQQSDEAQFTQQFQFLNGKDLLQLQIIKLYKQKFKKTQQFFKQKNKQILQQILTNYNSQSNKPLIIQLQSILSNHQIQHLASAQSDFIKNNNLIVFKKFLFDHSENKMKYELTLFKNQFFSLKNVKNVKNQKSNNINNQKVMNILYLNCKKIRKNKKKLLSQAVV